MPGGIGSGGIVDVPFPPNGPNGYVLGKTGPLDYQFDWVPPAGGGGGILSLSGGTTRATGPEVVFSNSNGVSFGVAGNTVTASVAGGGGGNTGSISAGTTRATLGEVVLGNSNGISFGVDGQTVTASYTVPLQSNQTLGGYALGNTTGESSSSTYDARTLSLRGDGIVSLGWSNSSIRISATQSNQAFSAEGGSSAFQTLSFRNANGITFSNSAGSVEASYTVPVVPAQFSGGNSNLGNTLGDTGAVTGRLVLVGSQNITLSGSTNGGSMTISISGGAGAAGNTGSISAGTTRATLGEVVFSNSNGISFGVDGQTVTASYTVPVQSNQTLGGYALGNTTGESSSSTWDARTLSLRGDGIVSVGWSNSSIRISATQSGQAFSAAGGSSAFQTLSFSNANGISFTNTNGQVGASYTVPVVSNALQSVGSATASGTNTSRFAADDHIHAGVFSMGVSNAGNTAGDTRVDVGRFVLAGGANITLSQATAAGALNTVSIVGAAGGGGNYSAGLSNIGNTSGDTGLASQRLVLAGGNNITLSGSTNGGSMTITVSAAAGGGGGAYSAGISTQGNTAGTTGFATSGLQLVGSQNITLSQSTGANGTITIVGPNAPVIRNYANLGHGAAGSASAAMTCASISNATLWVFPFAGPNDVFPGRMSLDRLGLLFSNSFTVTATSQAHTSSVSVAFYSQVNATQLSRIVSGSRSWSMAANANNTQSYHGARWLTLQSSNFDAQPTFSNTSYWCALWMRTSGTAHTASMGPAAVRRGLTHMSGFVGSQSSSASSYPGIPFLGYYSTSFTTGMPGAIALSDLVCTGSGWAQMIPAVAAVASDNTGAYGLW